MGLLTELIKESLEGKLSEQMRASLEAEDNRLNEANNQKGDYWVLNKAPVSNRKMLKLAQMGGVKYNGEWWFVSARRVSKESADEIYSNVKNDPNFVLVKTNDIQIFNGN